MNITLTDPDWRLLVQFLPAQWEQWAKDYGALTRARKIADAPTLLRLLLLHVAGGLSLRQTAVRAREHGLAQISDVALLKRLRSADRWLERLCQELAPANGRNAAWPAWCAGFRLRAVDSSIIKEQGAKGSQWRVHYSICLPGRQCDFFEVTGHKTGENLNRFPVQKDDLLLADRGFCRPADLAYVQGLQAHYVVRLHSTALPLTNRRGQAFDLLAAVRQLKGYAARQWLVGFTHAGQGFQARLCAVRRSPASAKRERELVLESARTHDQEASAARLELADYVLLLTSLEERSLSAIRVLQLYRLRWQIELAFKRLKSLLGLGLLPKYDPRSARAWLQAKLLTALLIERLLIESETFSPWGFELSEVGVLEHLH
jgi:hypothetical protein